MTRKRLLALALAVAVFIASGVTTVALGITDFGITDVPDEFLTVSFDLETGEITVESVIPQETFMSPPSPESFDVPDGIIGIDPFVIVGTDDRVRVNPTTSSPFNAIVHLEITFSYSPTLTFPATGFLISGNRIFTAAHNLYHRSTGRYASFIQVTPARNGNLAPYGTFTGRRFHIPAAYISAPDSTKDNYDYGVITLNGNGATNAGTMGLFTGTITSSVTTTGYGYISPSDPMQTHMYRSSGPTNGMSGILFEHECDTLDGNSGSPVYDNSNRAVGIHIGGVFKNLAVRITQPLIDWAFSVPLI
jgi:V8-like Glu-specific endopeptidase